jgi:hypothetical protein
MVGVRKTPVWLVLASYLIANTLAASWHDHQHHAACPAASSAEHHHRAAHDHHCALHHDHDCDQNDSVLVARDDETVDHTSDERQNTPHRCVVCEFLALAPLPAAIPALINAGEAAPSEVVPPVVQFSAAPIQAHPARGPPVAV